MEESVVSLEPLSYVVPIIHAGPLPIGMVCPNRGLSYSHGIHVWRGVDARSVVHLGMKEGGVSLYVIIVEGGKNLRQ